MALDQSIYDAFMFEDLKANVEGPLMEQARNTKAVNGILETALANNISNMQQMNIKEAAALSTVGRSANTPEIVAMGAAISALRDVIRTAQSES